MDRLTPAPSFRPTRAMTRTRQRPRSRHLSPSPRPGMRRTFSEASSGAVYITTDCDHELDLDLIPTSSPGADADLIFHMSPVHSHHLGRSSPPLSPLLYSFPRPSHTHGHAKQERTHDSHQNVPRRTYPISSARGLEPRPLVASLADTASRHNAKSFTPPNTPTRLHTSHVSAPIPIPRSKSRRVDLNQSVMRPPPSIISSSGDMLSSRFSGHSMASPLCRVEGFGGDDDDDEDADADAEESATDSRSLATPSTAVSYSYEAPRPLHSTKFFDDK